MFIEIVHKNTVCTFCTTIWIQNPVQIIEVSLTIGVNRILMLNTISILKRHFVIFLNLIVSQMMRMMWKFQPVSLSLSRPLSHNLSASHGQTQLTWGYVVAISLAGRSRARLDATLLNQSRHASQLHVRTESLTSE